MQYKFWFVLLLGCLAQSLAAQNVRVAYFGETVTHYGARAGYEYLLGAAEGADGQGGAVRSQFFAGVSLSVFRHPDNHIGAAVSPEFGWRRTGRRGGMVQGALSAGLFRSFYEGKTYRSTEDGRLQRTPLAGQWGFLPGLSLGVGRDLSVRGSVPLAVFANAHGMLQYPYNRTVLLRPALEVGLIFKNKP